MEIINVIKDSQDRVIEYDEINHNKIQKVKKFYFENGKTQTSTYLHEENKLIITIFDINNNPLRIIIYDITGFVVQEKIYIYNKKTTETLIIKYFYSPFGNTDDRAGSSYIRHNLNNQVLEKFQFDERDFVSEHFSIFNRKVVSFDALLKNFLSKKLGVKIYLDTNFFYSEEEMEEFENMNEDICHKHELKKI